MKWALLALAVLVAGCGQKSASTGGSGKLTLFGRYSSTNPATPNILEIWDLKSSGEYSREIRYPNQSNRLVAVETGEYKLAENWFTFKPLRNTFYTKTGTVRRVMEVTKKDSYTILVKQEGDKIILDPENSTIFGRQVLIPTN